MISIILPTYNEAENLPVLLPALAKAMSTRAYEVVIVDDDSPDRTWEVARRLGESDERIRVIRRVGRRGLSSAVIEGFLAARGDVFVVADADGQHDLSLVPGLASEIENGAGIAIGSRYTQGGSVGEWDERRHLLSRIATRMAIRLCKVAVTDPMSGFFALDRRVFEEVLPRLNPKGFKILLDLLVHIPKNTAVRELPFTFGVRTRGESKLSRRVQIEFLEYLYDVTAGRFIPLTFIKYMIVGALGVLVNIVVYALVDRLFPEVAPGILGFSTSFVLGVEAAILFNFFLNNSLTFSHAKLRGVRMFTGLLSYNVACLLGALANYALASYLYSTGSSSIASIAAGAFVGMIWNYTMSLQFTWRQG